MENVSTDSPAKRCAKCLAPMTDPDWVVNKEMAYCSDCAALLHLGESKESRMFNSGEPVPGMVAPGTESSLPRPMDEDEPAIIE